MSGFLHDDDGESVPLPRLYDYVYHAGRRKYPKAKVGDMFKDRIVIKLLPSNATSNERVEWRCTECAREGVSYVFNLRHIGDCVGACGRGQRQTKPRGY